MSPRGAPVDPSPAPPIRVLFVCLGNICRSPAAEGVVQTLLEDRGIGDRFVVDSAGTSAYHVGDPADRRMRHAASRRGHRLHSRSRQVTAEDFHTFDWIIAMDRENLDDLRSLRPRGDGARLVLFSEFLPEGRPSDVPDPYYGGERGFEVVLDLLEEAAPLLVERALRSRERE